MSRSLTKAERNELRHHLQVLSEQAKAVRNAIEPDTGRLNITVEVWRDQWTALTRNLDFLTDQMKDT